MEVKEFKSVVSIVLFVTLAVFKIWLISSQRLEGCHSLLDGTVGSINHGTALKRGVWVASLWLLQEGFGVSRGSSRVSSWVEGNFKPTGESLTLVMALLSRVYLLVLLSSLSQLVHAVPCVALLAIEVQWLDRLSVANLHNAPVPVHHWSPD